MRMFVIHVLGVGLKEVRCFVMTMIALLRHQCERGSHAASLPVEKEKASCGSGSSQDGQLDEWQVHVHPGGGDHDALPDEEKGLAG